MDEKEYLDCRVEDQIKWYDTKSRKYKKYFMRLKISETILALFIPFLAGYITTEGIGLKITVSFIGIFVAVITSVITLYKLQENWIQYRAIAESLKHEKFLYITKAGPYKDINSFTSFVERIENYISKENTQWATSISSKSNSTREAN